jgi:peptide/nickel transport system permease protein
MSLTRYILRRLLVALLLMFLVSSLALLLTLASGDVVLEECFDTPAECDALRERLGLNRSLPEQYADWMARAVRLDFGQSRLYTRPVVELLGERARNTAILASSALAVATLIGIPLGMYTAARRRGPAARLVRLVSTVLLSMPPLLASLALVMLAARTGWLPIGGMTSVDAATLSWTGRVWDVASHVVLPALALALPLAAMLERFQSQALAEVASHAFIRAAQARGLSRDRALVTHGWRMSLGAVLGLYGLMIGNLFSGSFVVEVATAWPGLGRLMYDGLRARDLYLVAGSAAAGAFCLAAGTLLADLLRATADPRVRLGSR